MSNYALYLNADKTPLAPIHPAVARQMLREGKAAIFRKYPFTIIRKTQIRKKDKPLTIKIDPGLKHTGIAIATRKSKKRLSSIVFGLQIDHRGDLIRDALEQRKNYRRSRRNRKTRYRQPRFLNRNPREKGWLPPSVAHVSATIETWVNRLAKFIPIDKAIVDVARFDYQKLKQVEAEDTHYRQGTYLAFEIREYLLAKYHYTCQYCGVKGHPWQGKQGQILNLDHIIPTSSDGPNAISNLTLSCVHCNTKKGSLPVDVFVAKLKKKTNTASQIIKKASSPAEFKSVIKSELYKNKLLNHLTDIGVEVEYTYSARTKYMRSLAEVPKGYWLDAAVMSNQDEDFFFKTNKVLIASSIGHGNRQMVANDKYGFPRAKNQKAFAEQVALQRATLPKGQRKTIYPERYAPKTSVVIARMESGEIASFRSGDIVQGFIRKTKDLKIGRLTVRANNSFTLTPLGSKDGFGLTPKQINRFVHRKDGYKYQYNHGILALS